MPRTSDLNDLLLRRLPGSNLLRLRHVRRQSNIDLTQHRAHRLTHLKRIYQDNKNKILNELARFDQRIDSYRKNGYQIKFEMQKLVAQIGQRKSFIE